MRDTPSATCATYVGAGEFEDELLARRIPTFELLERVADVAGHIDKEAPLPGPIVKRAMGLEPTTLSLGS